MRDARAIQPDEQRGGDPDPAPLKAAGSNGARPILKTLLEDYERQLIQTALSAAGGNQRRAAASLGLLPTTLHEKMKRLGLARRGPRLLSDGPKTPRPA